MFLKIPFPPATGAVADWNPEAASPAHEFPAGFLLLGIDTCSLLHHCTLHYPIHLQISLHSVVAMP